MANPDDRAKAWLTLKDRLDKGPPITIPFGDRTVVGRTAVDGLYAQGKLPKHAWREIVRWYRSTSHPARPSKGWRRHVRNQKANRRAQAHA